MSIYIRGQAQNKMNCGTLKDGDAHEFTSKCLSPVTTLCIDILILMTHKNTLHQNRGLNWVVVLVVVGVVGVGCVGGGGGGGHIMMFVFPPCR